MITDKEINIIFNPCFSSILIAILPLQQKKKVIPNLKISFLKPKK